MAERVLDILVISDLHYVRAVSGICSVAECRTSLGPVLVRKALNRLLHQGVDVDLIVVLGDVVDNGLANGADEDLAAVAEAVRGYDLPVLAVPGNHDGSHQRFAKIFECRPGLHKIGGYGFLLFHDWIDEGDVTTRTEDDLRLPTAVAAEDPELMLVALQHNPVHPDIESDYPYMLTNSALILSEYRKAGVILSLSGHYHQGQIPHQVGESTCYTVPAACEQPFRFAYVRLEGRTVQVQEHALRLGSTGLVDTHCHTEYAYCARDVTVKRNIEIAESMGLHGICAIEHSFQLYFGWEDAWSFRWQTDSELVRRAWEEGGGRMWEYRKFVHRHRSRYVKVGLELDLCAGGMLLVRDEDREGWDLLVGAVHSISGFEKGWSTQAQAEKLFLRDIEGLLAHSIDVLGHPFRFFLHAGLQRPVNLYGTVAGLLARSGVAAEMNFHANEPDPRFIEECLSRGVRIALGSDAHSLAEVGELTPHLEALRRIGVQDQDLPDVLFRPR